MEHWAAAAAATVENCHGDRTTAHNKQQPDFHISTLTAPLVVDALIARMSGQFGKQRPLEKSMCVSLASVGLEIAQCVSVNNATCV